MAQYGDQYGNQRRQFDEYGNPVRQTDEYGKPVHHGGTMGDYGTTGTIGEHGKEHHGLGGMLHRSGSSSSSSVCTNLACFFIQ